MIGRRWCLALLALQLACPRESAVLADSTPESTLAYARSGRVVTVRGTVFAVTYGFSGRDRKTGAYSPGRDRWALIRTSRPDGITSGSLNRSAGEVAWGLGLYLPGDKLAAGALFLPQIGDVVEATGTFDRMLWSDTVPSAGTTRPVLRDLSALKRIDGAPLPKSVGAGCAVDMECGDVLFCDRRTKSCAASPGIAATTAATATRDQLCPRTATPADLAGGRFAEGKEICVIGTPAAVTHPSAGESQFQLGVTEPLIFPTGIASVVDVGAVVVSPPAVAPSVGTESEPAGPRVGRPALFFGTCRFDAEHGRYTLSPLKAWWPNQ